MDKYTYLWLLIRGRFSPLDISSEKYSYKDIFSMNKSDLVTKIGLSQKDAEYINSRANSVDVNKEYDDFLTSGVKVVEYGEEEYPRKLYNINNPPRALFYINELPDEKKQSVAIIGARQCSEYGRFMAESLAGGLAKAGLQIISGMAIGIDGIAQMSALNCAGKSYGILGCGVDVCYPRANKPLYERLKMSGGVISEYANGTRAMSDNFPMRNRIISGLSDVIIVVEAKVKSGTMITVESALNQGKEIMVVPGRATDVLSAGCNSLIFQGAYPVQCPEDVLDILGEIPAIDSNPLKRKSSISVKKIRTEVETNADFMKGLTEEEKEVFSALDFYPMSVEQVSEIINKDFYYTMSMLLNLELKDVISEKGKSFYVRKL